MYRGVWTACLNDGGTASVQYSVAGLCLKKIAGDKAANDSQRIASSCFAGLMSGPLCSVLELTMIQQQLHGGSLYGSLARMVKSNRFRVLSRGVVSCSGGEALYTGAMLGLCPALQSRILERFDVRAEYALGAGALVSACIASTISHPLRAVQVCMQGDIEQVRYTNMRNTARSLINQYGVRQGLFRGWGWGVAVITTNFFLINSITAQTVRLASLAQREMEHSKFEFISQ